MEVIKELYNKYNGHDMVSLLSNAVIENASEELKKEYPDKIPFEKLYTEDEMKLRKHVQSFGQYEAEQRMAKEMRAKDIKPTSLLTIENLTKWIEEENKPYTEIARNTGNSASYVGEVAKKYNILSSGSKKRKQYLEQQAVQ